MLLPDEGRGRDYRTGANCADGCEWCDADVLIVCGRVSGLSGVKETGVDEVVAVFREVDYGAVNAPFVTELAEVGVGVPRCGTTCGRVRIG